MSRNTFISELIRQKRNIAIEFQPEYNLEKLIISVCAFLNSDGGWILVGHSGKYVIGIPGNIKELSDTLRQKIAEEISPQPLIFITNFHGKQLTVNYE